MATPVETTLSIVAALVATATACANPTGPGASDAGPVETCILGAWVRAPLAPCACEALGEPELTPECSAPDCMRSSVLELAEDGSARTFEIHLSEERSTLSVLYGCSRIVDMTWRLESETQVVLIRSLGGETTYDIACDATSLTRDSASFDRLDGATSAAVAALPTGDCQAVAFGM